MIEQTAKTVSYKLAKCPYYEAGRMAGLDGKSIESLCRAGALRYVDAALKQLNPKLCWELRKMRSSADDSCEEVIFLAE